MLVLLTTLALGQDAEIQDHLLEVVDTLRAETPADLPPAIRQRRLDSLDLLEDYAHGGVFPTNARGRRPSLRAANPPRAFAAPDEGRAPTFVDDTGVHCAVGYLMGVDAPELVDRVVGQANEAYLPDMRVEGVEVWAADHGFTLAELAWIQPTYPTEVGTCPNDMSGYVSDPRPLQDPPDACGEIAFSIAQFQEPCDTCGDGHLVSVSLVNEGTADGEVDVVIRRRGGEELAREPRSLAAQSQEFFLVTVDDWQDVVQVGATLSVEAEGNCVEEDRRIMEIIHFGQSSLNPPDCNGILPGRGCATSATPASVGLLLLGLLGALGVRRRR